MKTWRKRDWLDSECCAIDGAVEIETDTDTLVCDGDKARCTVHGCTGTVNEQSGNATIVWDDEPQDI